MAPPRSVVARRAPAALAALLAAAGCGLFGGDEASAPVSPADPADTSLPPATGVPLEGIFVSETRGDDANDGADPARPLLSFNLAIERAKQRQLRVFACAEDHTASTLELADGVSLYGGYDCSTIPWSRTEARARVRSTSATAVRAVGITRATRLDGFEIRAANAERAHDDGPAPSSIALFANDAPKLVLANVLLRAGDGAPGADGVEPAPTTQRELGTDGSGDVGFAQGACESEASCARIFVGGSPTTGWHSPGGDGGRSQCAVGPSGGPGGKGGSGIVLPGGHAVVTTGQGGGADTAAGGPAGTRGQDGARGAQGIIGPSGAFAFGENGFLPGDGAAGGIGGGGQGGGGGGGMSLYCLNAYTGGPLQVQCNPGSPNPPPASTWHASSGNGGGAGGCPGVPGTPGRGGGASLALVLLDSPAALERVTLESATGGRAGRGTLGLAGLPGHAGGALQSWGGKGGSGGPGGDAGLSGHGAAGPSIALVVKGAPPTRTDVKLVPGRGGEGAPTLTRGPQVLTAERGPALAEHAY